MEMQPVTCDECGNEVLVRKFSYRHTSVQWHGDASTCARFRASAENGNTPAMESFSCEALRASISRAVAEGRVPVPDDEDGHEFPGLGSPFEAKSEAAAG